MIDLKKSEIWFVTGSQHLYGAKALAQVAKNSKEVAASLGASRHFPATMVCKPTVTTPEEITHTLTAASADPSCIGLIFWMHTFSPSKMWIKGLTSLTKPFLHLHTQFLRDLPFGTIDMDYMNLHQAAHGDREFGFIGARMKLSRKVVSGHWADNKVQASIGTWVRATAAAAELRTLRLGRIGDNMREVAVTEGNKVSAEIKLGLSVNTHGVGDVAAHVAAVSDGQLKRLMATYADSYLIPDKSSATMAGLREGARIELGIRAFLEEGGFKAFTTTFQDLHGLRQLPGVAAQRLMADGYGFGAEGDWKTSALVRAMKVMAAGLPGGTSFMEDYTYHLAPGKELVLGAHMLEVCPSIAEKKPSLEVHALGIGGKEAPARLVFNGAAGPAVNASLIDLGHRFRLVINAVTAVKTPAPLPKLPVARVLWKALPDLATASSAWIHCGGAHHTAYSQAVGVEHLCDLAEILGIEAVVIDEKSDLRAVKNELRWNEASYT